MNLASLWRGVRWLSTWPRAAGCAAQAGVRDSPVWGAGANILADLAVGCRGSRNIIVGLGMVKTQRYLLRTLHISLA